jgi:hypothetical protein
VARILLYCTFATISMMSMGCSPMPGNKFRPLNALGRWSGYGFSDGYHACRQPCCLMGQRNCNTCNTCPVNAMPAVNVYSPGVIAPAAHFDPSIPIPGQHHMYSQPEAGRVIAPEPYAFPMYEDNLGSSKDRKDSEARELEKVEIEPAKPQSNDENDLLLEPSPSDLPSPKSIIPRAFRPAVPQPKSASRNFSWENQSTKGGTRR